jgi:hypothetical protein
MVYCYDCRHRKARYLMEYCWPVGEARGAKLGDFKDNVFIRAIANVHYNCPQYKRVWWKVWVKE